MGNVYPIELAKFGAKLKAARSQGEAWPLLVFDDVLDLWKRWPSIRNGIDGRPTFAAFLQEQGTGRSWTPARFKHVSAVVERLGESCRRTWTWPAAQWASNTIPDDELLVVIDLYPGWLGENHGHPLSKGMLQARVRKMRADRVRQVG